MSLTEGLLMLAAVVLGGLGVHGAWVAWRSAPKRAQGLNRRVEPALDGAAEGPIRADSRSGDISAGPGLSAGATHPSTGSAGGPSEAADGGVGISADRVPRVTAARVRAVVDPLIDAVAEVVPESPVSGEAALQAMPGTWRAGSKPLLIEGLNAQTGVWELAQHGQRYTSFQAGVQLANRSGALNEIEYSEFVQKVQQFADALGATADFSDMLEVVSRARELDGFAHDHDAQLAVHLHARGPAWTVGYLMQSAARHGAVAGPRPGQLVLPGEDADAPPMVIIHFDAQAALSDDPEASALRQCTISLDVPQTPEAQEPFAQWQRLAAALAQDLEGLLIDDDGRAVSLHQFAAIHHELQTLYRALESRDLPAGSPAARRLFS